MENGVMISGIDPGQFFAVLLGFVAIAGLSLHHRIWSARNDRIHTEAEAFGGRIDQRD